MGKDVKAVMEEIAEITRKIGEKMKSLRIKSRGKKSADKEYR